MMALEINAYWMHTEKCVCLNFGTSISDLLNHILTCCWFLFVNFVFEIAQLKKTWRTIKYFTCYHRIVKEQLNQLSGASETENQGTVGLQPPKRKPIWGAEVKRRRKARLQAEVANSDPAKSVPSSSRINPKGKEQATIANPKQPGGKKPQGQKIECGLQSPHLR